MVEYPRRYENTAVGTGWSMSEKLRSGRLMQGGGSLGISYSLSKGE